MADKYDNGYNSGDFKRNSMQDANDSLQDGEDGVKLNDKAGEYMRDLLAEKIRLSNGKFPVSMKLIDQEVVKVQASGRAPGRDNKYLDVYKEKPAKVSVKVLVPLKEHPKFNFVGKLLGPKGNTMKQLQEETMCKMAVLGRGSMRDRAKEEELRNSLDPKYAHLTDELHVEISSIAPPAEAHARIAYALAEVKKYLIPDPPEGPGGMMGWGQPPMEREMMPMPGRPGPHGRPPPRAPARMPAPPMPRGMPPKAKVISILDRARSAMETNYSYDDYGAPEPMRVPPRGQPDEFYYDRAPERFYEDEPYYKDEPQRTDYKQASSREVGTRRPPTGGPQRHHGGGGAHNSYARAQPYGARPQKSGGKPRN